MKFISESVSKNSLTVIGTDGTAVNTGCNNGVIRKIEECLGRPLQWAICQLHLNEQPFRHLFELVDGKTTGPSSYRGKIGQQIMEKGVELKMMPVVKFAKVKGRLKQLPLEVTINFRCNQTFYARFVSLLGKTKYLIKLRQLDDITIRQLMD